MAFQAFSFLDRFKAAPVSERKVNREMNGLHCTALVGAGKGVL
jgi:hypothetical protein